MPYIEKNYKVIAKPASRAIAGLSMGAVIPSPAPICIPDFPVYMPLSMGIRVTDENKATYDADFRAVKKAGLKLYWIACGDSDFLIEQSRTLDATLTRLGMKHTFCQFGRTSMD